MVYTVSLYLIDKAFGGREEGGWWFTYGEPEPSIHMRAFATEEEAQAYRKTLEPVLAELNEGLPSIDSVLSRGVYDFIIDEGLPRAFPETRPHYE